MDKQDEIIKILRAYMGFNCACDVAEEIDKLYQKDIVNDEINIEVKIDEELCPVCGNKLHWTYDIKDNHKVGEDPRVYGVICSNCCYEKYDEN